MSHCGDEMDYIPLSVNDRRFLRSKNVYKLYKITNTVNGKLYIGITKLSLQERFNIHVRFAKSPKYPLQFAIAKYGEENFTIELIEESKDRKHISESEEPAILHYDSRNNGYNVAIGGYGGNLGPEATTKRLETINNYSPERKEEHRKKLRERNLGKTKETDFGRKAQSEKIKGNSYRKGVLHSVESREKISLGNKGKIRSEQARQNYSNSAKIRGIGFQLRGKKVGCLCCKKEWDLGNYTQHIKRKNNEFQ